MKGNLKQEIGSLQTFWIFYCPVKSFTNRDFLFLKKVIYCENLKELKRLVLHKRKLPVIPSLLKIQSPSTASNKTEELKKGRRIFSDKLWVLYASRIEKRKFLEYFKLYENGDRLENMKKTQIFVHKLYLDAVIYSSSFLLNTLREILNLLRFLPKNINK